MRMVRKTLSMAAQQDMVLADKLQYTESLTLNRRANAYRKAV